MNDRIGFMQGRLSPLVDGKIQAFPWTSWEAEFPVAAQNGFALMEWTLDQDRLYENPLMTAEGQAKIGALCRRHGIRIASLTGDCFMQAPFWKASDDRRAALQRDFLAIVDACAVLGISFIVVPLVDNGSLGDAREEELLVSFLTTQVPYLQERGVRIVFECDFGPADFAAFIAKLDARTFGINYDIGNSAALGYEPAAELAAYGARVFNVHIKDRVLGGTTVPLGTGAAQFDAVFSALGTLRYAGNYILQTARATANDHDRVLVAYRDMARKWIDAHGA